jgi:hypothetical protein
VLRGYHTAGLRKLLASRRIASDRAEYEPGCLSSEAPASEIEPFARDIFGGLADLQVGCVHGRNAKLNALEYHKSSEVVVVGADMIVFVGLASDIQWPSATYDLSRAQAFFVPRGTVFEMYPWCLCPATRPGRRLSVPVILPARTRKSTSRRIGPGRAAPAGKNKWSCARGGACAPRPIPGFKE